MKVMFFVIILVSFCYSQHSDFAIDDTVSLEIVRRCSKDYIHHKDDWFGPYFENVVDYFNVPRSDINCRTEYLEVIVREYQTMRKYISGVYVGDYKRFTGKQVYIFNWIEVQYYKISEPEYAGHDGKRLIPYGKMVKK